MKKIKSCLVAGVAVALSCTLLFGCGSKGKSEDKNSNNKEGTSSSQSTASPKKDGETTTSTFNPGGKNDSKSTANPKQTSKPTSSTSNPNSQSSASSQSSALNGKTRSEAALQSELDDAQSFAENGMLSDAKEMLASVDVNALTDEQRSQYNKIEEKINSSSTDNQKTSSNNYTADQAIKMVENQYGVSLGMDTSGLEPQTNSGGTEYYEIEFQIPSQNVRKKVNVYQNGDIEETLSEPIAFG